MENFHGIFTALLTPFAADGRINDRALAWLIERSIRAGVTGFYACGSTAEVFTLSHDERRMLMRLSAELNSGRATMIAHVGAISTDESVALAKEAAALGYDGYDEMFLSGFAAGADGGIASTYNFMAEKYVRIRECFLAGKMGEARAVQHECNEIIRVLVKLGVMAGEKAILNLLGGDFGGCRKPFADCDAAGYALFEREVMGHLMA